MVADPGYRSHSHQHHAYRQPRRSTSSSSSGWRRWSAATACTSSTAATSSPRPSRSTTACWTSSACRDRGYPAFERHNARPRSPMPAPLRARSTSTSGRSTSGWPAGSARCPAGAVLPGQRAERRAHGNTGQPRVRAGRSLARRSHRTGRSSPHVRAAWAAGRGGSIITVNIDVARTVASCSPVGRPWPRGPGRRRPHAPVWHGQDRRQPLPGRGDWLLASVLAERRGRRRPQVGLSARRRRGRAGPGGRRLARTVSRPADRRHRLAPVRLRPPGRRGAAALAAVAAAGSRPGPGRPGLPRQERLIERLRQVRPGDVVPAAAAGRHPDGCRGHAAGGAAGCSGPGWMGAPAVSVERDDGAAGTCATICRSRSGCCARAALRRAHPAASLTRRSVRSRGPWRAAPAAPCPRSTDARRHRERERDPALMPVLAQRPAAQRQARPAPAQARIGESDLPVHPGRAAPAPRRYPGAGPASTAARRPWSPTAGRSTTTSPQATRTSGSSTWTIGRRRAARRARSQSSFWPPGICSSSRPIPPAARPGRPGRSRSAPSPSASAAGRRSVTWLRPASRGVDLPAVVDDDPAAGELRARAGLQRRDLGGAACRAATRRRRRRRRRGRCPAPGCRCCGRRPGRGCGCWPSPGPGRHRPGSGPARCGRRHDHRRTSPG